jgi:hypothetical protein
MTCRFLRLSMVRIFPRVADQAKNVVLKGTLVRQILFQGKWVTSLQARTLLKELTTNPFLEVDHQSLSLPSHLTLIEYNKLKNEAKTYTSQSWAALTKLTFHLLESPEDSKWATTKTFFAQAIRYKSGKVSFKALSLHHRLCQNLWRIRNLWNLNTMPKKVFW